MEDLGYNWSPKLIVELIKIIAWPVVVLVIGFSFRTQVFSVIRLFFSKNTISEISASASGLSAKFVAAKQSLGVLETDNLNNESFPKNMTLEVIRDRHEKNKTEYSEELYQELIILISSLNVSNESKVELLAREVSLYQSAMRYFGINKFLFRSQYNLFSIMVNNGGAIRKDDAYRVFDTIKNNSNEVFSDWDLIKYIAYPVSIGLIYEEVDEYKLTSTGRSYVAFMSRNPQLVEELAKL
ncbi:MULTISPECIES: hypothetical protein [Pectobacterium]|uniref:hypothetical protein n=1 Tax=Pectobacterium TaxID=122277 RepID=UPI00057C7238|nr:MULTISPECIES: hypothetical protein [Pectobacterium]KHT13354.1 hypothetical protein RC96_19285 [Pectobacterium carotovorum subsp. carotovorum]POD94427.1 hypothetical protein BVY06_14440 [Pectobacterium odoriferum]